MVAKNAPQLARELKAMGFTGSYCSVRRRVAHWKRSLLNSTPQSLQVRPISAKQLSWLLIKNIDDLDERDQLFIDALLKRCADIRTAAQLATDFVAMIHREGSDTLDSWIKRAWNPTVPQELRRFATSLKSDFNAVEAGLTTTWSNDNWKGK